MKLYLELSPHELNTLGDKFMASLSSITSALDELSNTLETELQQIADALANTPSQAEIDAVAQRVLSLKDRVANIIP